MTKLYQISESLGFDELKSHKEITEAADIINSGGLVAFPTETVYGLGANAFDADAARRIYSTKGRPSDNPLIVHVSNVEMIEMVVKELSDVARVLIAKFFPGPLTLIMEKNTLIPNTITAGLSTVAFRMPSNSIARALIEVSGVPIAAPSANISGRPSPTHFKHVIDDLNGRVDAIICSEDSEIGIESTILDISEPIWKILRPGVIGWLDLKPYIENFHMAEDFISENGKVLVDAKKHLDKTFSHMNVDYVPKAPGMKYKHYSPIAKVQVFRSDMPKSKLDALIDKLNSSGHRVYLIDESDAKKLANQVFRRFREADESGFDLILVREVTGNEMAHAVMNRINKAADEHLDG